VEESGTEEERGTRRRRLQWWQLPTDYRVEMGQWFRYGFAAWGSVVGPILGFGLLAGLLCVPVGFLARFIPLVGPLLYWVAVAPLPLGPLLVTLQQLKGKPWSFKDLFRGYLWFGHIHLFELIMGAIGGICIFLPTLVASLGYIWVAGGPEEILPGGFNWGILVAIPGFAVALWLWVRVGLFTLPLMVERGYNVFAAIGANWRLTGRNFLSLLGFSLLMGLLAYSGLLLCGIGVVGTAPLALCVTSAAYLMIAGLDPPKPLPGKRSRASSTEEDEEDDRPRSRRRPRKDEDAPPPRPRRRVEREEEDGY
jgi:hypothetical protein